MHHFAYSPTRFDSGSPSQKSSSQSPVGDAYSDIIVRGKSFQVSDRTGIRNCKSSYTGNHNTREGSPAALAVLDNFVAAHTCRSQHTKPRSVSASHKDAVNVRNDSHTNVYVAPFTHSICTRSYHAENEMRQRRSSKDKESTSKQLYHLQDSTAIRQRETFDHIDLPECPGTSSKPRFTTSRNTVAGSPASPRHSKHASEKSCTPPNQASPQFELESTPVVLREPLASPSNPSCSVSPVNNLFVAASSLSAPPATAPLPRATRVPLQRRRSTGDSGTAVPLRRSSLGALEDAQVSRPVCPPVNYTLRCPLDDVANVAVHGPLAGPVRRKSGTAGGLEILTNLYGDNKTVTDTFKHAAETAGAFAEKKAAESAIATRLRGGVVKEVSAKEGSAWAHNYTERERVAVIVGIDEYDDPKLQSCVQCVRDARELTVILERIGFKVTLLSTDACVAPTIQPHSPSAEGPASPSSPPRVEGQKYAERHPELYPTKVNIMAAIERATRNCSKENAIGLVVVIGGGFVGEVPAPLEIDTEIRRRASLLLSKESPTASSPSSPSAGCKAISCVVVPPECGLSTISGVNTITLSELAQSGCTEADAPQNYVIIDTYSVLGIPPCDPSVGGFCITGGRKCIGSELMGFYKRRQRLLYSFYLRRGLTGYATRDSRISINGLNAYISQKLQKYGASFRTTASTFFIGDVDLARVNELKYCRYDLRNLSKDQYNHFCKLSLLVIPTRNQDPETPEFPRLVTKRLVRALRTAKEEGKNVSLLCTSVSLKDTFYFFMRSISAGYVYLNPGACAEHETRANKELRTRFANTHMRYRLRCFGKVLCGCLVVPSALTRRAILQVFDSTAEMRRLRRLRLEAQQHRLDRLKARTSSLLPYSFKNASARGIPLPRTSGAMESPASAGARSKHSLCFDQKSCSPTRSRSTGASENALRSTKGPGYFKDIFSTGFTIDGNAVHDVGVAVELQFITSENLACRIEKLVRLGLLDVDLIVVSVSRESLDENAVIVERLVTHAQAIIRGFLTRRLFTGILALLRTERDLREQIISTQVTSLFDLQRNNFGASRNLLATVETKQRTTWREAEREQRWFFYSQYVQDYFYAARKEKASKTRLFAQMEKLERHELLWRLGFSVFALALLNAMAGMIKVEIKDDFKRKMIASEEAIEWRVMMSQLRRTLEF